MTSINSNLSATLGGTVITSSPKWDIRFQSGLRYGSWTAGNSENSHPLANLNIPCLVHTAWGGSGVAQLQVREVH